MSTVVDAPVIAAPPFACVVCRTLLPTPSAERAEVSCTKCGFNYEIAGDYIKYDSDILLRKKAEKQWVLWKVLNNNGQLSYILLKEGSLSLPDREDVQRFRDFLELHMRRGNLLDIGCGPLPIPGYLMFKNSHGVRLIGLDPIGDIEFRGTKVIGTSEYLPWQDGSIDTIVFATSLDHVCLLEATIDECHRVLAPDGRVIVWMSDQTKKTELKERIKKRIKRIKYSIRKGYRVDKYQFYDNGVVLHIPNGAVDPFHTFIESPDRIKRLFQKRGFDLVADDYRSSMEVNLCFSKHDE